MLYASMNLDGKNVEIPSQRGYFDAQGSETSSDTSDSNNRRGVALNYNQSFDYK